MAEENKEGHKKPKVDEELENIKGNYQSNKNKKIPEELTEENKQKMEKTREELEKLKKAYIKKHSYIRAIGILPPQIIPKFVEEEFDNKEEQEKISKLIHLIVIIPEEKYKKIKEIRTDLIKISDEQKQKVWVHVMSHVDVFNYGLDGKYEFEEAIGMAYPLYDKDFLSNLRVAEIHKSLVLRKFEKYIVSYVIGGSFVRGDTVKESDVDTYVIIDDTDVKRMPRLELKEKLRGIIYNYIAEASELAGVKNLLNVQIYLLTDFWEAVKDAQPVFFTLIRDGIPLYDRGTFMPWKMLLKMGKLKPSPEAIDMFMRSGEKLSEIVKRRLLDIAIGDIYWSVITPTQAMIMLYGRGPPTTKETPGVVKEIFYDKEKMLEKKYVDFVTKVIGLYKGYEHQKVKEVSGKEVDELLEQANDYIKRLGQLRKQIEKSSQKKTVEDLYKDFMSILEALFGKKEEITLMKKFTEELIKKGKINPRLEKTAKELLAMNKKIKEKAPKKGKKEEGKSGDRRKEEIENLRKEVSILIRDLVEYNQRAELMKTQRGRLRILTKEGTYEVVMTPEETFLIDKGVVKRITSTKIEESSEKELLEALNKQTQEKPIRANPKIFEVIRKELGEFEIVV
ncbi:hypothetical protein COU61_03310 [Candidatus Pacearchaeota archaeon CG10_big_fil_rev_8_21_14_0_10_35_13]|nr:MAG: hypothetical protein COU61_03310 [Candidatus Pacearchaeota archaeon CG10_big_fil_rev_8_21_14_0_10_35_13]